MKVYRFLSEQFQISKELSDMMYHTGIANSDLHEVLGVCGISYDGKNKDQVAFELAEAILSCYSNSDNYNETLYFNLVRQGTKCDKFYVRWPQYSVDDLPEDDYGHGSMRM